MKQVTDKMIAELTGGRMDNYVLEGAITLVKGLTDDKALNEELEKEFDFLLESSTENNSIRAFVTKMGNKYIGDRSRAEWFVENNLVVDDEHPHQVALMVERSELDNSISNKIGYVGFSHRSSVLFVIGDKLFDEEYEYDPKDFTTEENKNFEKSLKAARRDAMENDEIGRASCRERV